MKIIRHISRLSIAAAAPASMFLAQSWLIATGRPEAVLGLAQYGGLLGLIFFAFDGNSGLVPALMRLRHTEATIRTAYLVYRGGILVLLATALPLFWHLAPDTTGTLLPFCALALLLRLPFLDADLDQRGLHHWSMLLQNLWMLPLAGGAVLFGKVDAMLAGHVALWSTLVFALVHRRARVPSAPSRAQTPLKPALLEILNFMGAQGLGQLYGRATLFGIGAAFAGPLPSLLIYAKQVFNAAGLLVLYLKRVELGRGLTDMRLSLSGQAAIAVLGSVIVGLAALKLSAVMEVTLALIAWQVLEKLSATAIYIFQRDVRHDRALGGLSIVVALGLAGLAIAVNMANSLIFVAFETLGYCTVLLLLLLAYRRRLPLRVGAEP